MQMVALYTQKVEKKKITFGMIHRYKTHWFGLCISPSASDITSEQQQKIKKCQYCERKAKLLSLSALTVAEKNPGVWVFLFGFGFLHF